MAPVWAYVPAYAGAGIPAQAAVISEGLAVGSNMAGRENWILLSSAYSMGKCAYYYTGGTPPYNIGFLIAVKSSEYSSTPIGAAPLARVNYVPPSYYYNTITKSTFSSTYGDFNYSASTSAIVQVIQEELKLDIPLYETLADALDALNDGYWDGPPPTDPYADLGISGPGGGDGDMDLNGDDITHPSAPSLGAANTGFVTLYSPTLSDLRALASYMWSGLFDIDTWRRIFADPMSAILGLSILPISVPTGGSAPIKVGSQTTSVSAPVVSSQYVTVNMGSLDVKKLVGCYLDFDPYTKLSMYLPYIGFVPLSADDVMGRTINLQYIIDVFSGSCVATLTSAGSVVGSWAGCCATQIPITSQDWSTVISGALSVAATGAALVAGASAVAPLAVAGMANTAINSQKPNISRSGSMSGSAGMLGVQQPFIIATRPRPAIPGRQNVEIGYPAFIDEALGDLSGFTVIENVHLEGIPATQAELEEIDTLLHEGVIL